MDKRAEQAIEDEFDRQWARQQREAGALVADKPLRETTYKPKYKMPLSGAPRTKLECLFNAAAGSLTHREKKRKEGNLT